MFKRKCIALVLVCTILFCLLPGTAAAAEIQEETVMESTPASETETMEITVSQTETEEAIEAETETIVETESETIIETEAETEMETEETLPETEIETEIEIETGLNHNEMTPEEKRNYMCRMGSTMQPLNAMQTRIGGTAELHAASASLKTRFSSYSRLKVIDVSVWQGSINWTKVKASGIQGVFIRVGGRDYEDGSIFLDSNFATNIKGAKSVGLKVGVYFFSQAISNSEATTEAKKTLAQITSYRLELPVIIDYEWNGGLGWRLDNNTSKTVRTGVIRSFCETVENAGYETGVYASASVLYNNVNAASLAKEYNIWIAHYNPEAGVPDSPCVFDGWQYTVAEAGTVNGISTDIDMDYWYEPTGSKTFKDVYNSSLYYYKAVYWASGSGITKGYFNMHWFKPADTCTREQMVTFLWRMKGSPEPSLTKSPFSDVTSGKYYYKAVLWAYEKGITKGYSNRTFGVGKVCLREQAMTFLWRAAGSPEPTSNNTFSDIKNNTYYYNAVLWGCEN